MRLEVRNFTAYVFFITAVFQVSCLSFAVFSSRSTRWNFIWIGVKQHGLFLFLFLMALMAKTRWAAPFDPHCSWHLRTTECECSMLVVVANFGLWMTGKVKPNLPLVFWSSFFVFKSFENQPPPFFIPFHSKALAVRGQAGDSANMERCVEMCTLKCATLQHMCFSLRQCSKLVACHLPYLALGARAGILFG